MRKNYKTLAMLILITAGSLFKLKAQECPWQVKEFVTQSCAGQCTGSIVVLPWDYPAGFTFTYEWSTGSTANAIRDLCLGQYSVTLTDDKGCSFQATYNIITPAAIDAKCEQGTKESYPGAHDGSVVISVGGGNAPYEIQWNTVPVQYGLSATGLGAGSYTATITDFNKCTTTVTCIVEVNECGTFRTQTMGAWGQCQQNGNNPGTYLAAHFASAFPNGLTVGCNKTLKLNSSQAVCDFLPSGSTPAPLQANYVDPGAALTNVLAGQVVTLAINLRFDEVDPNFAPAAGHLGDLVISYGTFAGMTVNQLFHLANRKLGHCSAPYTAAQINKAVTKVNENFDNGTTNNGYLHCAGNEKLAAATTVEPFSFTIYPNPASQNATVNVISKKDSHLTVELYNIIGKKVAEVYNQNILAGDEHRIDMNTSSLSDGIYIVNVTTSEKSYQQKLVIKK
jgi:hypothetical protein